MFKSLKIFWFLGMFVFIFSGFALGQTLVFNTQDFPPFSYKIAGEIKGPGVAIIEAVCEKINVDCSFRLLPWTRAQMEVKTGKANAMFVIGWNKARDEWLYFTPPILKTEYGFFIKDDSPLEFKAESDIKGYKVGVLGPSNTSKSLKKIKVNVGDITIDMRPDDEPGFKKLSVGRVDAVFSNRDVGAAMIKKNNLKNLRYAGKQRELNYYIGFSKEFNDKSIIDKFNNGFRDLYKDGTIKKILDKYFMEPAVIE